MTAENPNHDWPVVLLSLRVASSDAARCLTLLERLQDDAKTVPRPMSRDILRAEGRCGTDLHVLLRFADPEARTAWQGDTSQLALLAEIEAMALAGISRQETHGPDGRFDLVTVPAGAPHGAKPMPPLWKRWTVSMLAVYPALVFLVALLGPVTDRLPAPVGLFLVALVLTGLNTAFILPVLNRHLGGWLSHRRAQAHPRATLLNRLRP